MRFQNWDVLIFPYEESKIPLQEFKTGCQVIQDPEIHLFQKQHFLLPILTTFIPSLSAGAPFRVSVHCWENPELSRYLQAANKFSKAANFEARIFVDGRLVGYIRVRVLSLLSTETSSRRRDLDHGGPWPCILETSIDPDKHGDIERLRFPTFHPELLAQSYWNAGDDLGRIKVVIAEGLYHEGIQEAFERVKNVVSFSFQHAPLDLLEASNVAWPNAAMWRQVPIVTTHYAQAVSPKSSYSDANMHGHSPRHVQQAYRKPLGPISGGRSISPPSVPVIIRQAAQDPFLNTTGQAFALWRQPSSDISMPDYSKPSSRASSIRNVTDTITTSNIVGRHCTSLHETGACESFCDTLSPASLHVAQSQQIESSSSATTAMTTSARLDTKHNSIDKAGWDCLAYSAADTANIMSRKENVPNNALGDMSQMPDSSLRKNAYSLSLSNNSGLKRQRATTPVASKVIDREDQPRASPLTRKLSRHDELVERDILGGIENV